VSLKNKRAPFAGTQAILFDLDGVLWPSSEGHRKAFERTLGEFKMSWALPLRPRDYAAIAGMTTELALEKLAHDRRQRLSGAFIERFADRKRQWAQRFLAKTRLEPGLRATLAELRRRARLGIVSSSHSRTVALFLKLSRSRRLFEVVISQAEAGVSKPHPRPYRLALRALKVSARQAIAVEDTLSGLRSARSAGIGVVGMRGTVPPARLMRAGAIKMISKIRDLVPLCG
jgi:HAD superfamily hydrolase (TIGR01509 family)